MHRTLRLLHAATVVAGAIALTGCARSPVGPGSNEIRNPVFLTDESRLSGPFSSGPGGGSSSQYGEREIDGAAGGELKVGRFTVTVPAGAFAGAATVSINVPDAGQVRCQLEITPASANQFAVPVILRVDCSGTSGVDPSRLTEIWFDESAGVWRQVPGSHPIVQEFDVVAPLTHFSDYGVIELSAVDGKAGW